MLSRAEDKLNFKAWRERLAVAKKKKKIRTRSGPKEYTYLGCPLTRNQSPWCYRLCQPDTEGHGRCRRLAPHSIKSRVQQSIEDHKKKLLAEHLSPEIGYE